MAPRRKKQAATAPAFKRGREFKVILPEDISKWIEQQAEDEGRPQSRIIINHLSRIPDLEKRGRLDDLIGHLEVIVARESARITIADLSDELLRAIDGLLEATNDSDLRARTENLRVIRAAMLKAGQAAKK